jgi:hypothetical protein
MLKLGWTLAGLALTLALAPPVRAAESPEALFGPAGFTPFSQIEAQKREVRRALFQDPFITLSVPGVEFERSADGQVTMTLIGPGVEPRPTPLPPGIWERLVRAEAGVFDRPSPLPDCPAWSLRLAATGPRGTRLANVSGCVLGDPGLAYAAELTRIAVATRPDCVYDPGNPFWTFPDCFE